MKPIHVTPILNVSNIQESFSWFEKLGWKKAWDWGDPPDFGAVSSGGYEIFLCEDCQGGRGESGAWMSIFVDDVEAVHQRCVDQGLDVTRPPTDMPWNLREMHVRHPDGHIFRIGQGLEVESAHHLLTDGPPIKIERVDVPVRLEKRLAALISDLAKHKHMSLTSCLEEILLHTCEPLGGGVASPHTHRDLERIQQLKQKHGIDYDSHGSYRFVEE